MITILAILLLTYDVSRGKGYVSVATTIGVFLYMFLIGSVWAPFLLPFLMSLGCFKAIGGKLYLSIKGIELVLTPGDLTYEQKNRSIDEQLKKVDQMLKEAEKG